MADVSLPTPTPPPLDSPIDPAPGIKLHTQYGVLIATFIGSPLAGCAILALNEFRLGNPRRAWLTVGGGVLGTALLVALASLIPDSIKVNTAFMVAQILIMNFVATRLQGQTIKAHTQAGGLEASKWGAAGIGLVGLVLCLIVIVGVLFLTSGPSGTRMECGASEIYYAGAATKEDALAFGGVLEKQGLMDDSHPITIEITKTASGFALCFVVNESNRDSPDTVAAFEQLGHEITKHADLRPLTIWLCDDDMTRQKKIDIR